MATRKFISRFSPGRTDPADLEAIFVQRQRLLDHALEQVRESALTKNKHYQLFVGPRGAGKTHLLALLAHRARRLPELADKLRIAWLNEDETSTSILDLLARIYRALEEAYPAEFPRAERESLLDEPIEQARFKLEKLLLSKLANRTLLILIENIDLVFEALGTKDQRNLRAFVQDHPTFTIAATAQRLFEGISSREAPFFGFFQTEHLKFLTVDEAAELLRNIARLNSDSQLEGFLSTAKGRSRVRALHHISGGNHRIFIVLSEFITRDSLEQLVQPFEELVDDLTPYYQEKIRSLAPLQRKIVEFLCGVEGTVPVKEIARNLFSTHQTISSQLKALREMGYVESRQDGRESRYELAEPLLRLCVQVKATRKAQPLRLVVDFLRIWYDNKRLKNHLAKLPETSVERQSVLCAIERMTIGPIHPRVSYSSSDFESRQALREQGQLAAELLMECSDLDQSQKNKELIESLSRLLKTTGLAAPSQARLLNQRAMARFGLGDLQESLSDLDRALQLRGVPGEEAAETQINRSLALERLGRTEEALAGFTRAIGLKGATGEQLAKALVNRGLIYGQLSRSKDAIADYDRVINGLTPPPELAAASLCCWARELFAQAQWNDALAKLEVALPISKEQSLPLASFVASYLRVLAGVSAGERDWEEVISALAEIYRKHNVLTHLGAGLVQSLSHLQKSFLNEHGLLAWRRVWMSIGPAYPELSISLRIFSTGIDYLIETKETVFLQLAKEERGILQEALGLSEQGQGES